MTNRTTLPSPPTVQPDHLVTQELERQLAQANQDRARLTAEHAELSFAVVTGASQDRKQFEALAKQIAELDAQISMLVAARTVARKRDQERLAALRLQGQRNRVERVGQLLARRTQYAAELTELLTKAARAFRLLSENSEKVSILSGVNVKSGRLSDASIRELVANELYRLAPGSIGNTGATGYQQFPGGVPADPTLRLRPYKTPALADRLAEADAWVTRELARLIAEDQLSPGAKAALATLEAVEPVEAPELPGTTPAPASDSASPVPISGETGRPLTPYAKPIDPTLPFNLAKTIAATAPPTRTARQSSAIRGH